MEIIVSKRNDVFIILNRLAIIIFLAKRISTYFHCTKYSNWPKIYILWNSNTFVTFYAIEYHFDKWSSRLENDNRPLCPELFQDVRYGPFNTILVSLSSNLLGLFLDSFHAVSTQMILKLVISTDCTYLDVCSVLELPVSIPYLLFVRCSLLFGDSHQQKAIVFCVQVSIWFDGGRPCP